MREKRLAGSSVRISVHPPSRLQYLETILAAITLDGTFPSRIPVERISCCMVSLSVPLHSCGGSNAFCLQLSLNGLAGNVVSRI